MMRWLLGAMTAGLLVKFAFSAVIGHWAPLPDPHQPAWNTAKEQALARAAEAADRVPP